MIPASHSETTNPGGATVNVSLPFPGPRRVLSLSFVRASNTDGAAVQATNDALDSSPTWATVQTISGLTGTGVVPWRGESMRVQFANTPGEVSIDAVAL